MLIGVVVFLLADKVVETRFGQAGVGGAMGIVVGSVVDGVPESIIFGIQVGTDFPISLSFLAAVFVSNIPQSIAPSADLSASGWTPRRVGTLWFWIVLACGIAAALGFLATDLTSEVQGGRAAALAAGGLLAMLTNSLMPFAFERGGRLQAPRRPSGSASPSWAAADRERAGADRSALGSPGSITPSSRSQTRPSGRS
jgi:zinc transporter, ZIP family